MSRTNNTHPRNGAHTWSKRSGNKAARVSSRRRVKTLEISVSDQLREDIAADRLEDRGALIQAMKLRNRSESGPPRRRHDP